MNWQQLLSDQRGNQGGNPGQRSTRSAFEQDYDRVIFSHPFRRLQDKTQVHPLPEDDFVHTRLTHSLEVSSVGRSLGKKVGQVILERHENLSKNFDLHEIGGIVAAASLAHDIGNPPFGHSGEEAISEFFRSGKGSEYNALVNELQWADLTQFEGNAQGCDSLMPRWRLLANIRVRRLLKKLIRKGEVRKNMVFFKVTSIRSNPSLRL